VAGALRPRTGAPLPGSAPPESPRRPEADMLHLTLARLKDWISGSEATSWPTTWPRGWRGYRMKLRGVPTLRERVEIVPGVDPHVELGNLLIGSRDGLRARVRELVAMEQRVTDGRVELARGFP